MASLIKTRSKNKVKFLIFGIAESSESLIDGHKSVIRQFFESRIEIRAMEFDEIKGIFDLVEKDSNYSIKFGDAFISEVNQKSQDYETQMIACKSPQTSSKSPKMFVSKK